jgi:hypothetical protein
MMAKISRYICSICVNLILIGCASTSKPVVSPGVLSQIKVDVSTKEQVRQLLGDPTEVTQRKMLYSEDIEELWGYKKGAIGIFNIFGTSGMSKDLGPVIVFSPDGVVTFIAVKD